MNTFHIIAAILATWRLTIIVSQDMIFKPVRDRIPLLILPQENGGPRGSIWKCQLCMSVWMGLLATILFYYAPFANWPFALSMLFLLHTFINESVVELVNAYSNKNQRKIIIYPDQQKMDKGQFDNEFVMRTLQSIVANSQQQQQSRPAVKHERS